MKKIMCLLIIITISSLLGCENQNTKDKKLLDLHVNVNEIYSISLSTPEHSPLTIDDNSFKIQFTQSISKAQYDYAQLDIKAPDYTASIKTNSERVQLSFWLEGSSTGLIVKEGEAGHYRLSDEAKNALLELFKVTYGKVPISQKLDEINSITVLAPSVGHVDLDLQEKWLGVIEQKDDIGIFYHAINTAQIPNEENEIITIGPRYDFVIATDVTKQHFSYWSHPNLKMIYDHDTKLSYFLSKDAIEEIDNILSKIIAN